MCVLANLEYLSILFCAVFWAAAPGLVAVLRYYKRSYIYSSTTVVLVARGRSSEVRHHRFLGAGTNPKIKCYAIE